MSEQRRYKRVMILYDDFFGVERTRILDESSPDQPEFDEYLCKELGL